MLVLVAGLPGSGKSYFAEILAARLNSVYVNSDKVRVSMNAKGKYSHEDKLKVYKETASMTETCLQKAKDVVVDATFYHRVMRELFLRIAMEYNTALRIIEVVADEELIKRRLLKPRPFSEADFSVYEKIRDEFETITMPHLKIESGNDNIESMIAEALTYLRSEGE